MEQQQLRGNVVYPQDMKDITNQLHSVVKILTEIPQMLSNLRRIYRGEVYWQDEKGQSYWVQMVKPVFVMMDCATGKPIKKIIEMPWKEKKEVYIPNDEAIEEVLSILSFMGINQVTPLTNLAEDNILDDLKYFEIKLATLLCLKQKEWGIDKELIPLTFSKISTQVQDVRYMARQGITLKTMQTNLQRVEQVIEGNKPGVKPFG
jgi:hypothetical protein